MEVKRHTSTFCSGLLDKLIRGIEVLADVFCLYIRQSKLQLLVLGWWLQVFWSIMNGDDPAY